jgi:hypothetical protein
MRSGGYVSFALLHFVLAGNFGIYKSCKNNILIARAIGSATGANAPTDIIRGQPTFRH